MNIRTYFAVAAAKCSRLLIRTLGKILKMQGTDFPGHLADKISPNILYNINKPERNICVTGTNGKTTTVNLITDILQKDGKKTIGNIVGSNTYYGIVTSILDLSGIFRKKVDIGVFEIDELWARKILPVLKPEIFVITNLFQDSFERNGNVYYIEAMVKKAIHKDTKLILNADDAIVSNMELENEKVFFSVDNIFNEPEKINSPIEDVVYCPKCNQLISWEYKRYHHIGKYHCNNCGLKNPYAKYRVTKYLEETNEIVISEDGENINIKLINKTIENVYNIVASFAALREYGMSKEKIKEIYNDIEIIKTRYEEKKIGKKNLISLVMKGCNPIASSRTFDTIAKSKNPKTVIVLYDNLESGVNELDEKDAGWIFATDFTGLKDETINKIIVKAKVSSDYKMAFNINNIPTEKVEFISDLSEISEILDKEKEEEIYLLHDIELPNQLQAKEAITYIEKIYK